MMGCLLFSKPRLATLYVQQLARELNCETLVYMKNMIFAKLIMK
jgi:hypothetical protein